MSNETITDGKVVTLDYVLTSPAGVEHERSTEERPLVYLHGARNIVPGLEEGLAGKQAGDRVEVRVPPEKGYGPKQRQKTLRVLRSKFPPTAKVERGSQFIMQGPEGQPMPIWIAKVQGREVHVTTQHPLAGEVLCFDVTVREVRDATDEEKAHGHVHGPGGHAHDEPGAEAPEG